VLRLDHVVYAVRDLDEAAARFRREFGLDSVVGGRHAGWGTANRIVPLGEQYLELIAAVDESEATATTFGRSLLERIEAGEGWHTFAVASDDVVLIGERLGLEIDAGSRERLDGEVLRWRMAGLEDPKREPWMPFFLTWDVPGSLHPGHARAGHAIGVEGIAWVEVGGDAEQLSEWLGDEELPIRVMSDEPGIRRVAVATPDGDLVVE
jgi:catechol 2,3-dioxygenase-like lactoylglutathione lyase family enzyme